MRVLSSYYFFLETEMMERFDRTKLQKIIINPFIIIYSSIFKQNLAKRLIVVLTLGSIFWTISKYLKLNSIYWNLVFFLYKCKSFRSWISHRIKYCLSNFLIPEITIWIAKVWRADLIILPFIFAIPSFINQILLKFCLYVIISSTN